VAIGARGLPGFRKLTRVRVLVTVLTDLRGAFELDLFRADRRLVAIAAQGYAVRPKKWEFGFRVVEAVDIGPRAHVVASFAPQKRAVGALRGHAILEFSVMRILVAGGAAHVLPTEG